MGGLSQLRRRPPGGPDRLLEQLIQYINDDWESSLEDAPGDSPIEKLLFRALVVRAGAYATEYSDLVVAHSVELEQRLKEVDDYPRGSSRMIVRPQAQIGDRRVDFLIWAKDWRGPIENWHWRALIVECDGHDYHERTKEQAAKDRSRDRAATLSGIDFLRFTGSEIWRDPWGCAEQIADWAIQGFG